MSELRNTVRPTPDAIARASIQDVADALGVNRERAIMLIRLGEASSGGGRS